MRAFNITGRQFGQLTAVKSTGINRGGILWRCLCSCGAETRVTASSLIRGRVHRCVNCRNSAGPRQSLADRFWAKVDKNGPVQPHMNTPCWAWTGARHAAGYGWIMVGSKRDGTKHAELAHRVSWELQHGPIPIGEMVLHECDFPPCVRHLFLGDAAANSQDMARKGRHHFIKLAPSAVLTIRTLRAAGVSRADVARRFAVNVHTISDIVHRTTWRHV